MHPSENLTTEIRRSQGPSILSSTRMQFVAQKILNGISPRPRPRPSASLDSGNTFSPDCPMSTREDSESTEFAEGVDSAPWEEVDM